MNQMIIDRQQAVARLEAISDTTLQDLIDAGYQGEISDAGSFLRYCMDFERDYIDEIDKVIERCRMVVRPATDAPKDGSKIILFFLEGFCSGARWDTNQECWMVSEAGKTDGYEYLEPVMHELVDGWLPWPAVVDF